MTKNCFVIPIVLLLICICICAQAQAGLLIQQGDKVYRDEVIDATLVVGWEQQLAWWSSEEYGSKPDLVIDTTNIKYGGQHNMKLTIKYFPAGTYYKWDNEFEPGANPVAFILVEGTRPLLELTKGGTELNRTQINIQTGIDQNKSIFERNMPEIQDIGTDILMCRGYPYNYTYTSYTGAGENTEDGYFWLFGRLEIVPPIQMETSSGSGYTVNIPESTIKEISVADDYTALFQFIGENKWQDISYDKRTEQLITPYWAVGNVSTKGIQPKMILSYLNDLKTKAVSLGSNYNDDTYKQLRVTVKEPETHIFEYVESGDFAYVLGTTTIPIGEEISIWLDEERFNTPQLKRQHLWTTLAEGSDNNYRIFKAIIPIKWDEMKLGNHTLTTFPSRYPKQKTVFTFQVTSIWVNPTQAPENQKVVVEGYGVHRITMSPTPTPTPQIIYVNTTIEKQKIIYVTVTPPPTLPPTPTESAMSVEIIGAALVLVCAYVVLKRK